MEIQWIVRRNLDLGGVCDDCQQAVHSQLRRRKPGMLFISPSLGKITLEKVFEDINTFINHNPQDLFKIVVGTDSMTKNETIFVSAIVIHRIGKGARYYYRKEPRKHINSLRQRVFYEAALSMEVAIHLKEFLATSGLWKKSI